MVPSYQFCLSLRQIKRGPISFSQTRNEKKRLSMQGPQASTHVPEAEKARSTRAGADGVAAEPPKGLRRSARNRGSETPAATPAAAQPGSTEDPDPTPQTKQPLDPCVKGAKPAATAKRRPNTSRCGANMPSGASICLSEHA